MEPRRSGNFGCKNVCMVCVNHENKEHEMYFTTDNHYSQQILYTRFRSSQLVFHARQLLLRCPQLTHGANAWTTLCSVSDKSSVFTATVGAYSILQFSFACEQFANSCKVAKNPAKLFVPMFSWRAQSQSRSLNLGTQNTVKKIFMGILDHENIFI